jgi:uncharacterized membrane protein YkoI
MRKPSFWPIAVALFMLPYLGVPLMAFGDTVTPGVSDTDDDLQQDEARQAVKLGLVRPLEEILGKVRKDYEGDIIEIEFEKDDGIYVYEIEMIRPDGHLVEIKIDARTLAVLDVEDD